MSSALKSKTAQLVTAFEQRLGRDRSDLLTSADLASQGQYNAGFEMVRFIAHRIVGSARLFGCDALSAPAGRIERLVASGADTEDIIKAVNDLVDLIERTLDDGIPDPDWTLPRES